MAPWVSETVLSIMNTLAIILLGIIGAIAANAENRKKNQPFKLPGPKYLWYLLGAVVVLGAVFQVVTPFQKHTREMHQRTYDTILIKEFNREFENEMTQKRKLAAVAITEYLEKGNWDTVTNDTDAVDKVLEFFERIGFDEQRGVISAEVAHEYFSSDILFYYQACSNYIADTQTTEPSAFEHIKPLADDILKIESKKTGKPVWDLRFSNEGMANYCDHEYNSFTLKDPN
jgi:hypothetical protein